ncbi:hypothetical protein HDU99_004062, partial [Rhizoclosmatium hyalinum]
MVQKKSHLISFALGLTTAALLGWAYYDSFMTACEHDDEETYVPDDALVDEIQALPIAQRMFRNSKVYPFRPVQVSIENCDAETSLFGNWAGILCDLTQED